MTYCIYCKLDFDPRGPSLVFNFLKGMTLLSHLPPPFNPQVTGGSSGIGKSIAMECYRQGAFITLVARDEVSRNPLQINILAGLYSATILLVYAAKYFAVTCNFYLGTLVRLQNVLQNVCVRLHFPIKAHTFFL